MTGSPNRTLSPREISVPVRKVRRFQLNRRLDDFSGKASKFLLNGRERLSQAKARSTIQRHCKT